MSLVERAARHALGRDAVRRLKRATRLNTGLGLQAAGALGWALGPDSEWSPTPEELRAVFPGVAPRPLQRRIAANLLRDVCLGSLLNREGSVAALDRVRVVGAENLLEPYRAGQPVVVIFGHVGARRGPPLAVEKLGVRARVAADRKIPRRMGCVHFQHVADAASAMGFLRDSLHDLHKGIVPMLTVDRAYGVGPQVPFLDREIRVGRGIATLARAGARFVPVHARWISASIEATLLPPLAADPPGSSEAEEKAFMSTCLGWLETFVKEHPGELGLTETQFLAQLPRIGEAS